MKNKPKPLWRKCSRCLNGMLVTQVIKDGVLVQEAHRCQCWLIWKNGIAEGRKDNL